MAVTYRGVGQVRRVAVIGSGLIGAGWVAAYLAHGFEVAVHDPSPDAEAKVRAHVAACLLGPAPDALSFHSTLEGAIEGADLVQESTPERREVKLDLFERLGQIAPPDVLIASSTSNLPVTLLQGPCAHPERCVLGHPFNPVHLMPLVEIGGGEATDRAAVDTIGELYRAMGKRPVRLEREIFGHIANRLTAAMFREAVSLVANGIATVEDIDNAIRFGPALKWAIQGQFTTFHTSGGEGGLASFLQHFGPGIMARWETMTTPDLADPALQETLAQQVDTANGHRSVAEIARTQDDLLLELLKIIDKRGSDNV